MRALAPLQRAASTARRLLPGILCGLLLIACLPHPALAQPGDASVFVAQAILAYEAKRYEEALAALREALALDPENVDALYYSGLVNIALDRLGEAVRALERARGRDPNDEAILFQLGALYFGLGDYGRAQPLLERVFASKPRLDALGYYVGFMRYRDRNYQGALRAFRAGAARDANIQQLTRFYTGLALGVLGLPEQAAGELTEALTLQPASPLTGPAERLRDAVVAARQTERRWRVEARLGVFYDDNVPVSPDPSSRDLLVAELRRRRQRSAGELGALRLDYAVLRAGPFEATATYSFFTTYNNDLPDFNIVNHLGGLGGAYRGAVGALPYQLALQYTYDFLTLDGEEFVQRHTVAPVATLVESASNVTALQLRYQNKRFANDARIPLEERRSGDNWMAGVTHVFRLGGDRHLLKLGYQADYEDTGGPGARGRNFSYVGHRILAGALYTLPWAGIRLKYDLDVHIRDYRHRNTVLPIQAPNTKERFDTEYTSVLGIAVPLPYNLTLSVDYQAVISRSNLEVFTFTRNVVSATLIWAY